MHAYIYGADEAISFKQIPHDVKPGDEWVPLPCSAFVWMNKSKNKY